MNVAILNWRDGAHPDAGGAEVYVHEVGQRWAGAGHRVTLYSSAAPGLPERDRDGDLEIVRTGRLKRGTHHLRAPKRVVFDAPDVVLESINTLPYQLPLRSRRSPPFVPLVHQMAVDVWHAHLPRPAAALARRAEPLLYRTYRDVRVAAVSESTAADLRTVGVRSPVVVPQGGIGPQRMFEKEPVPTLLFVGRLARNKRPDHAIEAFRRVAEVLPEARLWIIGEGPMREELARHLPPGAHLIGRVSRNELRERMSKAHVLLATSVREGWGLVVTEANAMGTPAVAYDIPGLKDSVKNGVTGLLVDTNAAAIAAPVIRLLRDSNAYKEMVRNARQWGARCTWDATAGFLMELLEIEANSGESQPSNAMPTPPS